MILSLINNFEKGFFIISELDILVNKSKKQVDLEHINYKMGGIRMEELQLETGQYLLNLIKKTEVALNNINEWINKERYGHYSNDAYKSDEKYGLFLSECDDFGQQDTCGNTNVDLSRRYGNKRLLNVIRKELELQLSEFKEEFKSL